MPAGLLIVPGAHPSRSRNGGAVAAELRFYLDETTTPATVYTDAGLSVPHAWPIQSDDAGRFPLIYADNELAFTVNWSTDDGQSRTLDGIIPSVSAPDALLSDLGAAKLDGGNTFTGLQVSDAGFKATGALATIGFEDWTTDRLYQWYSASDKVSLFDGATNILEYTRAGTLRARSTAPGFEMIDTDVTGKAGGIRLRPYYSANGSIYNLLEGGGLKVELSDANAGAFGQVREILDLFTNTAGRSDDTGAFFPNGGMAIGEDGHATLRVNVAEILSTNTLHTADIPDVVSHTITGGAFVAITVETGKTGYAPNANGTSNKLYRVAAQGVGRPNVGHTNLIGWLHTDGSGATTGTVTIEVGGTNYVQDEVFIVASPPPTATQLDVGPQLNLSRDAPLQPGGYGGSLVYQGRSNAAPSIDMNYLQLLLRVIDNDPADPESALVIATASSAALTGGSTAHWEMGKAIRHETLTRPSVAGTLNVVGLQIGNTDLFGGAWTWTASQAIRLTAAAATLGLERVTASPGALGAVTFKGADDAANQTTYAGVQGQLIDATDGSEDGQLRLLSTINGTYATRWIAGAGFFANGLADPGITNMAASAYYSGASKVVGARKTGWGVPTGTLTRTTFATSTVTLQQLAERVAALISDLDATSGHGLIGA